MAGCRGVPSCLPVFGYPPRSQTVGAGRSGRRGSPGRRRACEPAAVGQRDRACRGCQGPDQPSPAGAPSAFGGLAGVQRGRQGSTWAETRRGPSRGDPAAHPVGLSELRRGLQLPSLRLLLLLLLPLWSTVLTIGGATTTTTTTTTTNTTTTTTTTTAATTTGLFSISAARISFVFRRGLVFFSSRV